MDGLLVSFGCKPMCEESVVMCDLLFVFSVRCLCCLMFPIENNVTYFGVVVLHFPCTECGVF